MESISKRTTQCDNCKSPILPEKKDEIGQSLQAELYNDLGETKDYDFCSEECLRQYLNGRYKKKKKARASFSYNPIKRILEVDFN